MKKFVSIISLVLVAAMLCVSLVSCGGPASDPDDALAALKDNGYAAATKDTKLVPAGLKLLGIDGVDCVVSGTKVADDKVETVTIVYFTDSDAAEAAFEKLEDHAAEEKEDESDWVFEKSGAMVYYGTTQGVKDAK